MCIDMHAYACIWIDMHACTSICMHMHAYASICMHVHRHTYASICIHMHAYACMHRYACICVICIDMHAMYRCACIHMHAYVSIYMSRPVVLNFYFFVFSYFRFRIMGNSKHPRPIMSHRARGSNQPTAEPPALSSQKRPPQTHISEALEVHEKRKKKKERGRCEDV